MVLDSSLYSFFATSPAPLLSFFTSSLLETEHVQEGLKHVTHKYNNAYSEL